MERGKEAIKQRDFFVCTDMLEENPGMSPREATIQSMREISGALVAIAVVLSAVFIPMAFFGGSTGVIYRQFSVTIVSAMVLSVLVALILSPALTSTLLRAKNHDGEADGGWLVRDRWALAWIGCRRGDRERAERCR